MLEVSSIFHNEDSEILIVLAGLLWQFFLETRHGGVDKIERRLN